MADFFTAISRIGYEGPKSKNALAFKFYDADRVVMGKPMREYLPFAMAWWHNLCNAGKDMFGDATVKPDPEIAARYVKQYQKFTKIYPAVKEISPQIG